MLRERLSMRKWVVDKEGVPRTEVLAMLTLAIVFAVLLGRSLIIELRPHVDADDGRTRQQLFDEAEFALEYISRHIRGAGVVSTSGDGAKLSIWHGEMYSEKEPLDVPKEPTHFYVTEDKELVAETRGDVNILAGDVIHVDFHPLYAQYIGMSLHAKADGELLEIRELLSFRHTYPLEWTPLLPQTDS